MILWWEDASNVQRRSKTASPFIACAIVTLAGVIIAFLMVSEPEKGLE